MFSSAFRSGASGAFRTGVRTFASGGGGGGGGGSLVGAAALAGAGYVWYDTNQKMEELQTQVDDLQVQVSGKTNSAFVFMKPHACKGNPGAVEKVLESKFKDSGIRITDKGTMTAEEIDKNMYIDTHYGAIASKAVKLKPSELNVPDKGKNEFKKAFGESWDDAVKAGKVYNAKDGAEKLGLDGTSVCRLE
jgi:hypothetical protein